MSAPTTNEMRNIFIYTKDGVSVLDKLSSINGWSLEELGIQGGHEYCLARDDVKVAISCQAGNIAMTSNVLPYDWNHDQGGANGVLLQLRDALIESGIQCTISASEKDLGEA
jgi:hypothetical protein